MSGRVLSVLLPHHIILILIPTVQIKITTGIVKMGYITDLNYTLCYGNNINKY